MNIDPLGPEKNSDQTSAWNDNSAINLRHVKSYRCSFCKRGFSNAQALGGHMNIHRKDRAKLKELSDENLLSLDITKTTDFSEYHSSPANSSASEETRKVGSDGKVDDLHDIVSISEGNSIRGLPLFAEAASVFEDDHGGAAVGRFNKRLEKSKMELNIHSEVDLELRLGTEPNDAKINQEGIV